jgi:RNA polymerase subunit RPABC4/transcription elongation factor Spt4
LLINRLYFITGDKCATHHMYSLATDLYGLGIMKDPDAFKKPMLWLRFAKACKRCGRSADGLLAVKVRADRT